MSIANNDDKRNNTTSQALQQKVSSNPSQASLRWVGLINWFESNQSVSVWKPNNFGYWQDRIRGAKWIMTVLLCSFSWACECVVKPHNGNLIPKIVLCVISSPGPGASFHEQSGDSRPNSSSNDQYKATLWSFSLEQVWKELLSHHITSF